MSQQLCPFSHENSTLNKCSWCRKHPFSTQSKFPTWV